MHPGRKIMRVRNMSCMLQRFEFKKATCWIILFSLSMLLSTCLHCLLGACAAGFGQRLGIGTWAPRKSSLGTSCLSDPFIISSAYALTWGFWNSAHKETIHYTWGHLRLLSAVNHIEHLLNCLERSGNFRCPRGTWAKEVPGSQLLLQSCGELLAGLCLFFIWEQFNLFSRKIEQTCHGPVNCKGRTKRLSVESLLLPGLNSGTLSLKDAASRENSSLISQQ